MEVEDDYYLIDGLSAGKRTITLLSGEQLDKYLFHYHYKKQAFQCKLCQSKFFVVHCNPYLVVNIDHYLTKRLKRHEKTKKHQQNLKILQEKTEEEEKEKKYHLWLAECVVEKNAL